MHVRIFDLLQTKMRHVWRRVATGVSDLSEKPAESIRVPVSATFPPRGDAIEQQRHGPVSK